MTSGPDGKPLKVGEIAVTYTIVEGPQQKFGMVALNGVDASRMGHVKALMKLSSLAPATFSLVTLSGDRVTVLQYYLSNGFESSKGGDKARRSRPKDADRTDVVTAHVTAEGSRPS